VLAALSLTVVVFTLVLLVGNLLREILSLLVTGGVRPILVLEAIGLIVPFLWIYALPMGLLTATLLVFGRFSADQELTAARASGLSLISLVSPILLISLACCGLSAWINLKLGPESRVAYKNLIYRARYEVATVQLPEKTYIHDFPGYLCYVDRNRDGYLEHVWIMNLITSTNQSGVITTNSIITQAPTGREVVDWPNRHLYLYLTNMVNSSSGPHERNDFSKAFIYDLDLKTATNQVYHPKISDMTCGQLLAEIRELRTAAPAETDLKHDLALPARVELNRQFAFSFASFSFALVGIPLGIRLHRRETNIGIVIGLGLSVIYYSFVLLGAGLSAHPEFHPTLILWLPNLLFLGVGAVLLWRANRGF